MYSKEAWRNASWNNSHQADPYGTEVGGVGVEGVNFAFQRNIKLS